MTDAAPLGEPVQTLPKKTTPVVAAYETSDTAPKKAETVKSFENEDIFVGGNPREQSLPGQAPGEKQYDKVRDSTGRLVSNKPANAPFLAYQKYKEEQADIARRRAAGEVIPEERLQWSWSGALVTLVTLLCLTAAVGNFVTGSPVWGQAKQIHRLMDKVWARKLQMFTPEELSQYDGSEWAKPIYIGLDGDVWDVSASARLYGPGGSYHVMAGRDAARAFVTGCFQSPDHLTPDTRGFSEQEMQTLNNWKKFFRNHEVYRKVGTVLHKPIDPSTPIPAPCRPAAGGGEDGTLGAQDGPAAGQQASKPDAAPAPQVEQTVGQKTEQEVIDHHRGGLGEL